MLHLGQNIKLIRGLAEKTQPDFAILISENLSNLKTYETKGVMPKLHIQHRIAKIGGVTVDDLLNKKLTPEDITINLEVEKVKKVKRETFSNNTPMKPQEPQHAPDYRDEVIALLKEKVNLSERKQLVMLQRNQALLNAIVETLPILVSKIDKVKLLEAHEEMNKRIEHHLDVLKKESI